MKALALEKTVVSNAARVDLSLHCLSRAAQPTPWLRNGIGAGVMRPGPRPIFWQSNVEPKGKPAAVNPMFYDEAIKSFNQGGRSTA